MSEFAGGEEPGACASGEEAPGAGANGEEAPGAIGEEAPGAGADGEEAPSASRASISWNSHAARQAAISSTG